MTKLQSPFRSFAMYSNNYYSVNTKFEAFIISRTFGIYNFVLLVFFLKLCF